MTSPTSPLPVLFRDDAVVVVNKPSGLLVHRGLGRDRVTALQLVRDAVGQHVFPVHRLDRPTSGALLFALTPADARALQQAFASGAVEKRYLALVRGRAPEAGHVDHPVPGDEGGERVPAVTDFARVASADDCSLVLARPLTGRFHQLRRHLKHAGHPIIGDSNYGKGALNRAFRERTGLARLGLHAVRLSFPQPRTGARVDVLAPLPDDLAEPLRKLGFDQKVWESAAMEYAFGPHLPG